MTDILNPGPTRPHGAHALAARGQVGGCHRGAIPGLLGGDQAHRHPRGVRSGVRAGAGRGRGQGGHRAFERQGSQGPADPADVHGGGGRRLRGPLLRG